MNSYTIHITLCDLFFFGMILIGLNFALLLGFVKSINRSANRYLALALVTMILWMMRILAIDIRLETYLPHWDRLPMEFLLGLGPLIYFYVLKITRPDYRFGWTHLLHFSPILLEQMALALEIGESTRTGAATYATMTFRHLNPLVQLLIFLSIIIYLYQSHKLIQNYYRRLPPILMDRSLIEFRWLRRLLSATALLWLLWITYAIVDYFGYHNQLGIHLYYPFYIFFTVITLWTAAAAFLKPQAGLAAQSSFKPSPSYKPSPTVEARAKGVRLKRAMETHRYYQDPELSLPSLAGKLALPTHELSRIINTVFKKNFSDFINEYRIRDLIRKMQDPAYDHITLLGLAFESGFNSKTTFNRIFKQITGKSPAEYKNQLKKERPTYNLERYPRPAAVISNHIATLKWSEERLNRNYMIRNYLRITWRNFLRNPASSSINLGGLAVGMAVAMLIGLWIWDELSFDTYHKNYRNIAMVMQNETYNGTVNTGDAVSLPFDAALRKEYGSEFKQVVLAGWNEKHVLSFGDKNIAFIGNFMSPGAPEMLTLDMLKGDRDGLKDKSSIFLSASTAKALFGEIDPLNKTISLDNKDVFKVSGVYDDLPQNTTFHDLAFIGPWEYYIHLPGNARSPTDWGDNSLFVYVQMADHADMAAVSAKIRDIKLNNIGVEDRKFKPAAFLQPMRKWHLYSGFTNGVNTGGAIQYVWLFGIIGIFVLLLACINFMNLSTARSEKRSKEVGIRKAVGSLRSQLVKQFYWESFLIALLSFAVAVTLVWLALPWFNNISGKQIRIPFDNILFWSACIGFTFFTGLIAGSYPAIYLSSFNAVKVLKGTFKAGPYAAVPRQILVVTQFAVSILLIIGTIVVFKQIKFARDRPVGYTRDGLLDIEVTNTDLHDHFAAFRSDLLQSGAVAQVAESSSAPTGVNNNRGDISWPGKDPSQADFFGSIRVTADYGRTVGWQFVEGRDFLNGYSADSLSVVLNETAVNYMGLKKPVGQIIHVGQRDLTVIGVIKNMVMQSPYEPVKQTIFYFGRGAGDDVLIRINAGSGVAAALDKIGAICKKYSPSVPFSYRFADDEYAKKFVTEVRIGKLAGAFAGLAIFISCLGLFGMASFSAEQRTKEIGIRKVLGATVVNLWGLMSQEYLRLVVIALLTAVPVAYYFMHNWLQHYPYHTGISWWIFATTAGGAVLITLLTVSYQSITAAVTNPVKSLRSE